MLLKLSPVTNLSDARYAAAAGFRYIGFCFDPQSAEFLLPIKAREIIDWTSGSHAVGEFGQQAADEIRELSELLNLDVVLLNNTLLPDEIPAIGKPCIKAIDTAQMNESAIKTELEAYEPCCDAFQLNGSIPVNLENPFWGEICSRYKIIWNIAAELQDIPFIKNTVQPYALNLQAGQEEATGMRDFENLNQILNLIEVA